MGRSSTPTLSRNGRNVTKFLAGMRLGKVCSFANADARAESRRNRKSLRGRILPKEARRSRQRDLIVFLEGDDGFFPMRGAAFEGRAAAARFAAHVESIDLDHFDLEK